MKLRLKLVLIIIAAVLAGNVNAQRIKATASLDSANILLGDQVKLFLEIDHPKSVEVTFPQVPDTISGLIEVISKSDVDTF